MRPFFDLRGHELTPGRCLGRGGEGAVYSLNERPGKAAKIYARRPDDQAKAKVAAMVALGTPQLRSVAAWPEGLLLESRGGEVAGFLMPKVPGHRPIHDLYGPVSRKRHFPRAGWRFLVRTARNLAAAFDTVHRHGLVVGDVNQGNAIVSPKALVRLIDCDSFQVQREGRVWPCRVGVPQFTPPELQGRRFDAVVRTREHDAFGLAVLVFHLLFMGRHPFAGRHPGREVPIEEAIREGLFAFGWDGAAQGSAPPPHSLRLTDVPREIQGLFEQALRRPTPGVPRPTARQWIHALDAFERSLVRCEEDERHAHAGLGEGCPWCRIEQEGGPFFFGLNLSLRPGAGFDLDAAWSAIEKVEPPRPPAPPPSLPNGWKASGKPLPPGMISRRGRRGLLGLTLLGVAAAVAAFGEAASAAAGLMLYVVMALVRRPDEEQAEQAQRQWAVDEALRELKVMKAHWDLDCGEAAFEEGRRGLACARREYEGLEFLQDAELLQLREGLRDYQLERYLEAFPVDHCPVPDLNSTTRLALTRNGIWTAAEVSPKALDQLLGLDPRLKLQLLTWRQRVERTFQEDPHATVPEAEIRAVHQRFRQRRSELEERLLRGPVELRKLRKKAQEAQGRLEAAVIEAHRRLAQAKADLRRA